MSLLPQPFEQGSLAHGNITYKGQTKWSFKSKRRARGRMYKISFWQIWVSAWTWRRLRTVWPDGWIICSVFGYLRQWQFSQQYFLPKKLKNCQIISIFWKKNIAQLLVKISQSCEISTNLVTLAVEDEKRKPCSCPHRRLGGVFIAAAEVKHFAFKLSTWSKLFFTPKIKNFNTSFPPLRGPLHFFAVVSVTRLGDFWKVLVTKCL